jgi:hypothetical protein
MAVSEKHYLSLPESVYDVATGLDLRAAESAAVSPRFDSPSLVSDDSERTKGTFYFSVLFRRRGHPKIKSFSANKTQPRRNAAANCFQSGH